MRLLLFLATKVAIKMFIAIEMATRENTRQFLIKTKRPQVLCCGL